jgi:hypothetical protein
MTDLFTNKTKTGEISELIRHTLVLEKQDSNKT